MSNFSPVLAWYTGKALAAMRDDILPTLELAEREESWPPGASRKVRAALSRQSVAQRFARANERKEHADGDEGRLDDVMEIRGGGGWFQSKVRGWHAVFAMEFGQFAHAPSVLSLCAALAPLCACDAERAALATARQWATDFAPIAELVARLDATRPKPSYVFEEISRTVLDNVGRAMGIVFASVSVPEIKWHKEEKVDEKGHRTISWWPEILWPAGTRHDRSKFAGDPGHCHACGHRIRKADNWTPLVADSAIPGESPMSLWVGRDCARHLFGCRVTGDADFRRVESGS